MSLIGKNMKLGGHAGSAEQVLELFHAVLRDRAVAAAVYTEDGTGRAEEPGIITLPERTTAVQDRRGTDPPGAHSQIHRLRTAKAEPHYRHTVRIYVGNVEQTLQRPIQVPVYTVLRRREELYHRSG